MTNLNLSVKREYFDQIKSGTKSYEYRLNNAYWQKRLLGKDFDRIVITMGYPKKGDADRTLIFPWRGYELKKINHQHFGPDDVVVFAIILEKSHDK